MTLKGQHPLDQELITGVRGLEAVAGLRQNPAGTYHLLPSALNPSGPGLRRAVRSVTSGSQKLFSNVAAHWLTALAAAALRKLCGLAR
jgi:hypothetical protein